MFDRGAEDAFRLMLAQQGAQWFAMGRQLLDVYPVYLRSIEEAGEYLKSLGCEWLPIGEREKYLND
jgi:hypothetical protein